ncbi:MAG: M20/M25/M40 family metallo-hydrolase, partial [Gemmatimonadales bacterium]
TIAPVLTAIGMSLEEIRADSGAMQVHELSDLSITIKMIYGVEDVLPTPNTVGILEGSDPELKNEYVVFSAHMDHVGTSTQGSCREVGGDGICNGADDDASGTIGIVELAEAFSMVNPRPRRSIIFVTVSGEEKGLWGSDYFALNPGVPRENIVANLNADMIGRNWTDTIVVIGKEHSDLGETLNEVNSQHLELNMTAIDDIWPNQNFYLRSDHYNFAKRGIPILFFFNGTHDNYHRPSDEVELIDAEKESRIVKLMFYLGLEIANKDARPEWNPESYAEIVQPVP